MSDSDERICGYCGLAGADKEPMKHPWPGQRLPSTEHVHARCDNEAAQEAFDQLSDKERADFLRRLLRG